MKKYIKTRQIYIIGIVLSVAGILTTACNTNTSLYSFKISTDDMPYELMMSTPITPDEAMEFIWDSTYVFVDTRTSQEYGEYHLDNAVNIPIDLLLTSESKDKFDEWQKDSLMVVLYGKTELEVTTPWMILYQVGYTNTRVMMGGMEYIDMLYEGTLENEEAYNVEMPAYDYAGIIEAAKSADPMTPVVQPKKIVVRKKEKKAAEGGC